MDAVHLEAPSHIFDTTALWGGAHFSVYIAFLLREAVPASCGLDFVHGTDGSFFPRCTIDPRIPLLYSTGDGGIECLAIMAVEASIFRV